jgi:hypothetical protein
MEFLLLPCPQWSFPSQLHFDSKSWLVYSCLVWLSGCVVVWSMATHAYVSLSGLVHISNDTARPTLTHWYRCPNSCGQDLIVIDNPEPLEYIMGVYGYSASQCPLVASTSKKGSRSFCDGVIYSIVSAELLLFVVAQVTP